MVGHCFCGSSGCHSTVYHESTHQANFLYYLPPCQHIKLCLIITHAVLSGVLLLSSTPSPVILLRTASLRPNGMSQLHINVVQICMILVVICSKLAAVLCMLCTYIIHQGRLKCEGYVIYGSQSRKLARRSQNGVNAPSSYT